VTHSATVAETKPERLVAAARALFHEQGYQRTALAEIAERADVPLGNVYYWFRTKRALLDAVVDGYARDIEAELARCERARDSRARLKALVRSVSAIREPTARFGCPYGSLCHELCKGDGEVGRHCAGLLGLYVDWAQRQFAELGLGRRAREAAVDLVASLQGASLLTQSFSSPELMAGATRRLERRIDELASAAA
jgi:AcrR family transcriptional regulator